MNRLRFAPLTLCLGMLASLLAGCHHAPQTAAELRRRMPGTFTGEIRMQGQSEPMHLRITPHDFTERSAQVLEFNSVQYAVLDAHGGVQNEGDAGIRGTITLPGLEVRLESMGDSGSGEDLVKPGSFQGKLSDDLQSGEANWTTSLGQSSHLKVEAMK